MPEQDTPATEKPAEPQKPEQPQTTPTGNPEARTRTWVSASAIGVVCAGLLLIAWHYGRWPFPPPPPPPAVQAGPSENAFQEGVVLTDGTTKFAIAEEWRSARSDHKAIAYTIAQCFGQDVDRLPRNWFSGLLLDLHPNGNHFWAGKEPDTTQADPPKDFPKKNLSELSSYARTILFLSDAVARARLEAADGADANWPQMFWFSWIVVCVSALGTLFVTLRTSLTDKGGWTTFLTIGAVTLSTAGTVLTSAKTFYDPARAYARNERTLLELQKLHQDVMLHFLLSWDSDPQRCDVKDVSRHQQEQLLEQWVGELRDQHEGLVLAAVGDVPLTVPKPNAGSQIQITPAPAAPAPAPAATPPKPLAGR